VAIQHAHRAHRLVALERMAQRELQKVLFDARRPHRLLHEKWRIVAMGAVPFRRLGTLSADTRSSDSASRDASMPTNPRILSPNSSIQRPDAGERA